MWHISGWHVLIRPSILRQQWLMVASALAAEDPFEKAFNAPTFFLLWQQNKIFTRGKRNINIYWPFSLLSPIVGTNWTVDRICPAVVDLMKFFFLSLSWKMKTVLNQKVEFFFFGYSEWEPSSLETHSLGRSCLCHLSNTSPPSTPPPLPPPLQTHHHSFLPGE